jgi:serine/threonine protein phosphatase PrpC
VVSTLGLYGVSKIMGSRRKNEDTFAIQTNMAIPGETTDYVAVFDGHGGGAASKYAREEFHNVLRRMLSQTGPMKTQLRATFHQFNHALRARLERSAAGVKDVGDVLCFP